MKVVRVELDEFELEDGKVLPIIPPLEHKMTPEEFQEHYERACNLIQGLKDSRGINKTPEKVGC